MSFFFASWEFPTYAVLPHLPSRFVELLGANARLTQNAPKRTSGQFIVKRHNAPDGTLRRLLSEHHMAAPLTHLSEAQSLKALDHFAV